MHPPTPRFVVSRWLPVLAYAGVVWYFSSQAGLDIPGGVSDKIAHAIEFGVLGALLWRAINGSILARPDLRRVLAVVGACAGYAAFDEIHQAFVPGRESSLTDLAADVAGVLLILGLLSAIGLRAGRSRERVPRGSPSHRPV